MLYDSHVIPIRSAFLSVNTVHPGTCEGAHSVCTDIILGGIHMKKNATFILAVTAIALVLTGCDVAADEVFTAGTRSASLKSAQKTEIDITDMVMAQAAIDEPIQMGSSSHYASQGEVLVSQSPVSGSGWDLINGTYVFLKNETTYNMDAEYDLWGANHSRIDFVNMNTGETVVSLMANGTIKGSYIYGAEIDMNWVATDGAKGTGKINGTFYWYGEIGPLEPPVGFFNLTGTVH